MEGDPVVDRLMKPVLDALIRHGQRGDARTDVYNRAYEAVMNSMVVMDTMREQLSKANARADTAERDLAALRERTEGVCRWRLEDDDSGLWAGDCGAMWTFTDGSPEENEMAYCPMCGRKLEQVEPEPPEDA